jgi:hypothetical protein
MQAPKAAFTRKHPSQRSAGLRWIGGTDYAQKSVLQIRVVAVHDSCNSELAMRPVGVCTSPTQISGNHQRNRGLWKQDAHHLRYRPRNPSFTNQVDMY